MTAITRIALHDLPRLRDFAEMTFRRAWQATNDPVYFEQYCAQNFDLERLRSELEQPNSEFYYTEAEGQFTAYLKINKGAVPDLPGFEADRSWQLERIYVHPDRHSHGLGAQLLQWLEQYAHREGATHLWLDVWQEAPRAIRFYERNGFEICGTADFWLGEERQTDWVMRKVPPIGQP